MLTEVQQRKAGLVAGRRSDPLAGALVGERWVVRSWLPDGSATDVIGWIEALDTTSVRLSSIQHQQPSQVIDRSKIITARRAPAAAGGPDPRRISADDLQRHALLGWLVWHQPLGEWTLRAAGGFTRRANSCHAVGDPGMPIRQAADQIIRFAAAHDIAPLAQVIEESSEEHALRGLGWVSRDQPTDVLVTRLADFLANQPVKPAVKISERLMPAWMEAYQHSRPNPGEPAIVRKILEGSPPRAFASVVGREPGDHSGLVAIARGHRTEDWLGLAAVWTRPDHRRRGLATAMTAALGHWAARQGARYAYIHAAIANEPAVAMYTKLDFVHHHRYVYLAPAR
jgi:RimJ/RimL family protein N-acetyltransferase